MLPDLFAPVAPGQLTFEEERDDLLRRYESDGRYRPDGQYAPAAFAGLRECFLPKMRALLQRHATDYPALLDGLELALSRIKRIEPSGRVAYEFDGMLLVERLERQVGRLKLTILPAGDISSGKRELFAALGKPLGSGPPVPQQRHHYEQASRLLGELARAVTRDLLAATGQLASAGARLWTFLPLAPVQLPNQADTLKSVIEGNGKPWSAPEKQAIEQWWRQYFDKTVAPTTAELRQQHEAAYLRYRPAGANPDYSLTDAESRHWAARARQAEPMLAATLFSADFFRHFFLSSILVATGQPATVRMRLAVAGLFGLTDSTTSVSFSEKQLRRETIRSLQALTVAEPATVALLFEEMLAWHTAHPISLDYQHVLSSYLLRRPDPLHQFYSCLPEEDLTESEASGTAAEKQAALCQLVAQLGQLPAAGVALIGSYLRPTLRALFDSPGFLADLPALAQLYGLLVEGLDSDEREVVETVLLEQALPAAAEPGSLLRQPTTALACCLRLRLRLRHQLMAPTLAVTSSLYISHRDVLQIAPPDEKPLLYALLLQRYDIRHFLFAIPEPV